jgi:farnesyl diphosphate synthase
VGSYLISQDLSFAAFKDYFRLGNVIGVSFQLLDDLNELTESSVSDHELEINPFLLYPEETLKSLSKCLHSLYAILEKQKLGHTTDMMKSYLEKNQRNFIEHQATLLSHFKQKEDFKIELEKWITSFVAL